VIESNAAMALDVAYGNNHVLCHADCVLGMRGMPDSCIDFSVYSPPFASLFIFSNSDHDMGNCKGMAPFIEAYGHAIKEKLRVTKPGRLSAVHCMNLPSSITTHGVMGLIDFRGEIIREHLKHGWIYHAEVCIWKNPVAAMQRSKNHMLLHKTYAADAAMVRQGLADYLVIFRKPGKNPDPVRHYYGPTREEKLKSIDGWQREASPIWPGPMDPPDPKLWGWYPGEPVWSDPAWFDIAQSDTLDRKGAREDQDEKHISPLQLTVIRRALRTWTNPGDVVMSPFAGIGSEGHVSLHEKRKFVGFELKPSYFKQAKRFIAEAEPDAPGKQTSLFAMMGLS
jgi:DNA modification methylase